RHDMRTFVDVEFDWSLPNKKGNLTIPNCHERRIRNSYLKLHDLRGQKYDAIMRSGGTMKTGHLIYPIAISVINGSKYRNDYYAAAVHKVYSDLDKIPHRKYKKSCFN
ncbi:hypothetical protein PMAYCL1PPCAC_04801, partial [Pristionchus mayeri]